MLTNIKNKFFKRILSYGKKDQVYIIPTFDGIKLLILNLILLIVGLVYANNFVLLFNFSLFCLFLGSMFYTHFNLSGLKVVSVKVSPLHKNQKGLITLNLKSSSSLGHFSLEFKANEDFINTDLPNSYSFNKSKTDSFVVELPITPLKRGKFEIKKIYVQTMFPFHLFRSFSFLSLDLNIVVYPEKREGKFHLETQVSLEDIGDEDLLINPYVTGDSLKHIHWKKLAQTNLWFSKKQNLFNTNPVMLSLKNDGETEEQLSSMCFSLYQLYLNNTQFGLSIGNVVIPPSCSKLQLTKCLEALAVYEK